MDFAAGYDNGSALIALPEPEKEILKLPRSYICNVLYTMIGDTFSKWVNTQVEARNEKIKSDKDMSIALDPEILKLFQASTAVSGE